MPSTMTKSIESIKRILSCQLFIVKTDDPTFFLKDENTVLLLV